jgi:uracil-DNA glycosylase
VSGHGVPDAPKTLAGESERTQRAMLLAQPHAQPLARLVQAMRDARGEGFAIPDFDPLDGGTGARLLFLLEAPGPKAVQSGFVSRNNPDETARNLYLLNAEAGIDRRLTAIWNAVPWYIGSGTRIRPADRSDIRSADEWLAELLVTLKHLRIVVLVGRKARHAETVVRASRPDALMETMPHPSPMHVNRSPGNRDLLRARMGHLADLLASSPLP